jgi:hypothetical protein
MTDLDKADIREGIKRRPEKKWKKVPKLSNDQKLIDDIIENDGAADIRRLKKKYEKTTEEIVQICNELGIY